MGKKYIVISIFLVVFAVTSCKKTGKQAESFEDFSASVDDIKEVMITDDKATKTSNTEAAKPEKKLEEPVQRQAELEPKTIAPEEKTISKTTNDNDIERPAHLHDFSTKYNLGYLSFDVADFYCELEQITKDKFRVKFYSKANGFINYLFGWMSYTTANFKIANNNIIPQTFKTKVRLRKELKEIELKYDANGKLIFENVTPPDNRAKRPAVAENLKKDTFDPLSLGVEARRLVIEAFKKDLFNNYGLYKFNLPLYDGRRRSDIMFTLHKKKVDNNYKLSVQQKKIAGFTDNEMKDANRSEKAKIDIYVEPNVFIPMKIIGVSPIGTATAKFTGNCENGLDNCITKK